ncbi:M14 metallopeptidase family protein [Tamlana flava]|uniref:M14 metallopeptidase family protein n=1 Tax=Tamlana flava TaxID=3158572 RepID=UPI00351B4BB9
MFFQKTYSQNIQSPSEFLGYELGTTFTRHHQIVDYYKYLAAQFPERIKLKQYGGTYENRPLYVVYLSSEKNIKSLEDIRKNNLQNAGIIDGDATDNGISIIWLSYNVHGNEASSSEASMKTIYILLKDKQDWLKNTVVIIDPCLNPDGRDRYVNWYNSIARRPYNTNPQANEHIEPWPSGRSNHYFIDLNRDWAWATQVETQCRLKVYNKWLPHIHVDFHEKTSNNYYFAPAAEPYHEIVTDWQRNFQTEIGKNHSKYFDKEGWLYYTGEKFDLFYPSYGDTYPTYLGAIGMTYEQPGHGRSGLGIAQPDGSILTLTDRILHHTTTGLSTIEMASKHAKKLNMGFKKFFDTPDLKYKSYVLQGNEDKIKSLKKLLDIHEIKYGSCSEKKVRGYNYFEASNGTVSTTERDLVVSTNQPKGKIIKVLFEPKAKLSDSLTYDITAWSIPYAYGLKTIASTKQVHSHTNTSKKINNEINKSAVGYILNWKHLEDAKFLASLIKQKIKVRFTEKPIKIEGEMFSRGSLLMLRGDNKKFENFDDHILNTANTCERKITPVLSGFNINGPDLGSPSIKLVKTPKIAILSGNKLESLNYGAFWHFFEKELNYPVTSVLASNFNQFDLEKYNIVILPSGNYKSIFNEDCIKKLHSWIKGGGKVIAIKGAIKVFANEKGFALKPKKSEKEIKKEKDSTTNLIPYSNRERENISYSISGSILKTEVDQTHPLAFGYSDTYFTLKLGNENYNLLGGKNYNVAYINQPKVVSGFTGSKLLKSLESSLVFGEEKLDKGSVIYMIDDVLFRSFWENGKLFMANAIFFTNNNL